MPSKLCSSTAHPPAWASQCTVPLASTVTVPVRRIFPRTGGPHSANRFIGAGILETPQQRKSMGIYFLSLAFSRALQRSARHHVSVKINNNVISTCVANLYDYKFICVFPGTWF